MSEIQCPFCGEPTEVELDDELESAEPGEHELVRDCDVCCRPITVRLRVGADGSLDEGYERD